jgi:hypothetical protein
VCVKGPNSSRSARLLLLAVSANNIISLRILEALGFSKRKSWKRDAQLKIPRINQLEFIFFETAGKIKRSRNMPHNGILAKEHTIFSFDSAKDICIKTLQIIKKISLRMAKLTL